MKTAYIVALVVILAVLVIAWMNTRTDGPDVTVPDLTPTTTDTGTSTMDDMDDMEPSTTTGSDVPFPQSDLGSSVDQNAKVFDVGGSNFAYDKAEIRVNKGDTVVINFTSTDGFHDWVVDEFSARTARVNTGGTSSVTFVADKTGTFEFYCSVGKHRENGMVGRLIVE